MPPLPLRPAPVIQRALAAAALLLLLLLALMAGGAQAAGGSPISAATDTRASTAPADTPEVRPGQSALEFALDYAPDGVTLEQFLLALIELNPQAFSVGEQPLSGSRLRLPSAEQAARVPADQARAELRAWRANRAAPLVQAPTSSTGTSRPIPEMVWVVCAAALMVIAMLLFSRTRHEAPYEGRHEGRNQGGPDPQTLTTPDAPGAPPEPQPGPPSRYRPALPPESEAMAPRPIQPAAIDSPLAQRPLSERADLPSLDLQAPPPQMPTDRPAPRPAAPSGPLDFSGIDLDLGGPDRGKP